MNIHNQQNFLTTTKWFRTVEIEHCKLKVENPIHLWHTRIWKMKVTFEYLCGPICRKQTFLPEDRSGNRNNDENWNHWIFMISLILHTFLKSMSFWHFREYIFIFTCFFNVSGEFSKIICCANIGCLQGSSPGSSDGTTRCWFGSNCHTTDNFGKL